jgi:hypothetical protein
MIKEEIAPGIVIYDNVIPNSENLYIDIEEGLASLKMEWSNASVKKDTDPGVDIKVRDTHTIGLNYVGEIQDISVVEDMSQMFYINLNNIFFENFDLVEKDYLLTYGISSGWHDGYSILKYGQGQQFTNHIDDHPDYHRRVSTVYYLNENYTGGEINFPRFNVTLKPKANQMIVFPSTYVYNHSVSPVIDGERYAVVSWLK